MLKKAKVAFLLIMALVFAVQGIGMETAEAARVRWTAEEVNYENLLSYMWQVSPYGVVAETFTQNAHLEANIYADRLVRNSTEPFLCTQDAVDTSGNSHMQATLDLPSGHTADTLTFGLYKLQNGSYVYTGNEVDVDVAGKTSTVIDFGKVDDLSLMREPLYIFQRENGERVEDSGYNTDSMQVFYGPPIVADNTRAAYIGSIDNYNENAFNMFQSDHTAESCHVIEFGSDVRLYRQTGWGWNISYSELPDAGGNTDTIYIFDKDWTRDGKPTPQTVKKVDKLIYRNGEFFVRINGTNHPIEIEYLNTKNNAAQMLDELGDLSYNLANSQLGLGGHLDGLLGDTPSPEGNSTVTGPVTGGVVLSLYHPQLTSNSTDTDFYVDMNSIASGRDSASWQNDGLPIADNEYVIINVVLPNGNADSTLHLNSGICLTLKNSDGTVDKTGAWRSASNMSYSRVIWNPVYKDDRGNYQPYTGKILAGGEHGGIVLAPEATIEQPSVGDALTLIGKSVANTNGQEIHQTSFSGARSFVRMTNEPTVSLSITKSWDDYNNYWNTRPASVQFTLRADGVVKKTITIEPQNGSWPTWEIKGLPKYNANGTEINYSVEEKPISGYVSAVEKEVQESGGILFAANNTYDYMRGTTSLSGYKIWDDESDYDKMRPDSISIYLEKQYQDFNGQGYGDWTKVEGSEKTITADDNWSWTYSNLSRYEGYSFIGYRVREQRVANYDEPTYITPTGPDSTEYLIKNTHEVEKFDISGIKNWHDNNNSGNTRPQSIKVELWKNGKYLKEVTVTAADNWKFSFTGLTRFDGDGNENEYQIIEKNVGQNYYSYVTFGEIENGVQEVQIANSIKKTKVKGQKFWSDTVGDWGDNAKNDVKLLLYQQVGEKLIPVLDDQGKQLVAYAPHYNQFKFEFSVDLPTYGADGLPAQYVVKEEASDKYIILEDETKVSSETVGDQTTVSFELTNMLTITLSGTKVWNDNSNAKGARPDNVTLTVYRADNDRPLDPQPTIEWDKETNTDVWTWKVLNLPKYDGSTLLSYYVKEEEVVEKTRDEELNYAAPVYSNPSSDVTDKALDGGTITNSLTGRIRLYKESEDGIRLNGVAFDLYKEDGTFVKRYYTEKTGSENGKLTIAPIPYGRYYLVEAETLDGYILSNEKYWVTVDSPFSEPSDIENGAPNKDNTNNLNVVINKKTASTGSITSVSVTKEWDDDNNKAQRRPASIQVQLLNGTEPVGEAVTLNAENGWTYTWENLDKYVAGTDTEIVYTVDEVEVPEDYIQTVTTEGNAVTITNTYVASVSVPFAAKKTLDGADCADGNFTFNMTGEKINDVATATNGTDGVVTFPAITYTLADMVDEVNGGYLSERTFTYTIYEEISEAAKANNNTLNGVVYDDSTFFADVKLTFTNNTLGYTVTYREGDAPIEGDVPVFANTTEKVSISVTKVWDDDDNKAQRRPASIKVQLLKNGTEEVDAVELPDEKTGWSYTWTDLPKYDDDGEITYTVAEITKIGETALPWLEYYIPGDLSGNVTDGFTITNTAIADGEARLVVNKAFNGTLTEGQFSFALLDATGQMMVDAEGKPIIATNNADGVVSFPALTFDTADTYKYQIKEIPGNASNIVYDGKTVNVEIIVAVSETEGKLVATVTYDGNDTATFTNTAVDEISVSLGAKKTLDGAPCADGKFTFNLTGDKIEGTKTATNTGENGEVTFDPIQYTLGDLKDTQGNISSPKTFTYTISEAKGSTAGMVYDETVYTAAVTLTYNEQTGKLEHSVVYTKNAGAADEETLAQGDVPVFANTTEKVSISVTKEWVNVEGITDLPSIQVQLLNGEDTVSTVELPYEGKWSYTWTDLPKYDDDGEITYTVDEVEVPEGYIQTVTTESNTVTITNTYEEEAKTGELTLAVKKAMSGREFQGNDSFTFKVTGSEGAPMPEKATVTITPTSGTEATVDFGTINFTEADANKEYTYTIQEVLPTGATAENNYTVNGVTYDTAAYQVKVTIANEAGKDELTVTAVYPNNAANVTITNTKLADGEAMIQAKKTLNGAVLEEGQFTFQLLKGDKVVDTKTNDANGNVIFDTIQYSDEAEETYTIVEVMPEGATEENNYTVNGMTYDPTEHTVTVKVKREGTALNAIVTYDGTSTEPPVFANTSNELVSVSVTKEWKHGTNSPTKYPVEVDVILVVDGKPDYNHTVKLTANNYWTHTWSDLPKYGTDKDGKQYEIDYSVKESSVLNDYVSRLSAKAKNDYVITNTYVEEDQEFELTFPVTKIVEGNETSEEFTFKLEARPSDPPAPMPENAELGSNGYNYVTTKTTGSAAGTTVNFDTIKITSAQVKYDGNAPSYYITYGWKISEVIPENKNPNITYDEGWYEVIASFQIDENGELGLAQREIWDENYESLLGHEPKVTITRYNADGTTEDIPYNNGNFALPFTNEVLTTSLSGTKVWVDKDASKRPAEITIRLLADKKDTGKYTKLAPTETEWSFTDLPVKNEKGETITYTVTEDKVPGYATTIDDTTITNTYEEEAKTGELTLAVKKAMSGREFQENDSFTFKVIGSEGAPMPEKATVTITPTSGTEATVDFGKINFTEENVGKEYTYTIQEVLPAGATAENNYTVNGVTYDTAAYQVTVTIANEAGKDELTVTAVYPNNAANVTITNTKLADGEAMIQAKKTLNGAVLEEGQFTFQLLAGGKVVDEKANDVNGIVTFEKLTYTEVGDYTYTIKEVLPAGATAENNYTVNGMTYDHTEHTVTVKVEQDDASKKLVATVTYANGVEMPVFTNTYEAKEAELTLSLSKTLINSTKLPADRTETFEFVLADEDGVTKDRVEVSFTNTNDAPQTATFKTLTFDAEGTYKYTISETASAKSDIISDATQYFLEVEVKDVSGQLVATPTLTKQESTEEATSAEAIVFTNTYDFDKFGELTLAVKKAMSGREFQENDSFTFKVTGSEGAPMPEKATVTITPTSGTEATVDFGKINFNEENVGKEYTYTIQEVLPTGATAENNYTVNGVTYDVNAYTVTVKVTEGAEALIVTPTYANGKDVTITNTYDANGKLLLTATKEITGDSTKAEQKGAFKFGVYDQSGKEIATGTNGEDGTITFTEIAYTLDQVGTHEYTVKETTTTVAAEVSDKYIVELDETEYTILVNVVNNVATGDLDVTWSIKEPVAAKLTFTNDFQLRKGDIGVLKVDSKDHAKGLAGAEFTVYTDEACTTILMLDGEEAIITTGETGAGALDDLPIGTYWVKETKAPQHYLLDEESVYEVTVVEGDRTMVNGIHVTNKKMAKLALEKSDRLNPDKKLPDAEYTLFTEKECENILELPDGTPAIITTGEDGVGELEGVPAGTYWVKETKAPQGYEVDPIPYPVTVKEDEDPDKPVFVQVSDFPLRGVLSLSKTVVASSEVTDTFLFDIELTLETGDPIVGSYKATLNGAETDDVTFAATETGAKATVELKDGETLTIIGLRSGVSYTVTEQPNSRYDVTVNGVEAVAATGTISDTAQSIVKYQNTLKETGFTVEKVWLGEDAGEIKLTLYANGVAMDPQPEVTRDGNTYSYENLVMKDENGEEIVYTVKETAMAGYTTTYQNAAPNADKTDAAYNGGKIINQAMTTFAVKKEWSGLAQGEKAPAIQLTLYCNGEVYTAATPTPDKDGWYTYADLPAYVDGEVAVYTVKEQPVTGFTTTYINKGENAAVTDCAYNGSTIVNSKIPQTGDNAPLTLWMLTTLLAACGLMGVMATLRKREN